MEITPRQWLVALLIAGLAHAALAYALVHSTAPLSRATAGITLELGDDGRGLSSGGDGAESVARTLRAEPAGGEPVLGATPSSLHDDHGADQANAVEPLEGPVPAPSEALVAKALTQPQLARKQTANQLRELELDASTKRSVDKSRAASRPEPARSAGEQPPSAQESTRRRPSSRHERGHDGSNGTGADGSSGTDGTRSGDKGGSGKAATGSARGGDGLDARNYYGRLATWLARHKRYPLQARRLGQEGTVKVTFTVSRSGRVIAKRVSQSSGHSLLDREAQAMLERASPLPRIPASLGRDSLTISLPVAFALR